MTIVFLNLQISINDTYTGQGEWGGRHQLDEVGGAKPTFGAVVQEYGGCGILLRGFLNCCDNFLSSRRHDILQYIALSRCSVWFHNWPADKTEWIGSWNNGFYSLFYTSAAFIAQNWNTWTNICKVACSLSFVYLTIILFLSSGKLKQQFIIIFVKSSWNVKLSKWLNVNKNKYSLTSYIQCFLCF